MSALSLEDMLTQNAERVTAGLRAHAAELMTQEPACWCHTCRPVTLGDMRFVVCPDCGNKRCPKATHHENACTGSNEPGQLGALVYSGVLHDLHEHGMVDKRTGAALVFG